MSGNYPPGVTGGEDYFNPPDRSHDHEWEAVGMYPEFEDGAAIFSEKCHYHQGPRRNEWVCEEQRTIRCDVEKVVKIREEKPNSTYLASEEEHLKEWRFIERIFEEAINSVEIADKDELDVEQIDPPNDSKEGYVRVSIGDYKVIYTQ